MKNEQQRTISIPRWHYRDTRAEVEAIFKDAEALGGLRAALVAYLRKRQERFPEGMTAESAVGTILETANGFAVAHQEGKTAEDIKEELRGAIAEMEPRQAAVYFAALEATFRSLDRTVADGETPGAEALRNEITAAAENTSENEIPERIEAIAEMILGDSLNAYVYASGNGDLAELIQEKVTAESSDVTADTANRIHAMLLDDKKKAELYAATACVCYGMVLDGRIEGMSATDLDARVMTVLVAAGMEKASILTRLARGEIDQELALEMLAVLARTVKWFLVSILQVMVSLTGGVIGAVAIGISLALLGITLSGWWLLAIGFLVGVCISMECEEPIERFVDFLGYLIKTALQYIGTAAEWCREKGKELAGSITVTQTAASEKTDTETETC